MANIMLLARPFANVDGSIVKDLDNFVDEVVAEIERGVESNAEYAYSSSPAHVWNDNEQTSVKI